MKLVKLSANLAAILGIGLCIVAVILRLMGTYQMAGIEMMTLFNVGIASMVASCLLKLEVIAQALTQ